VFQKSTSEDARAHDKHLHVDSAEQGSLRYDRDWAARVVQDGMND
jgi:hypothetical protein